MWGRLGQDGQPLSGRRATESDSELGECALSGPQGRAELIIAMLTIKIISSESKSRKKKKTKKRKTNTNTNSDMSSHPG